MKHTVMTFQHAADNGDKLAVLTAYDYSVAKLVDESGVHGILVGDSLGMVALGHKDTLSVTMEDMLHHSKAVARAVQSALLIVDMPFMSYQTSVYDAVCNAGRLVKEGGAEAVKLEGGEAFAPHIAAIVAASIPVMGHVGLTPQSVNAFGGFKVQGRDEAAARKVLADARAVQKAGAFAVVLECIPAPLAKVISDELSIPTIGIGAGTDCDGQVLVYQDMLGMFAEFSPKFVKRYAEVGDHMRAAFAQYVDEVCSGTFPAPEHTFSMDQDIIERLY